MTAKPDRDEAALQGVLNVARDEDRQLADLDARLQAAGLDRWLTGELSADEQKQLEARAQHDPELAEAMKLFAPSAAADNALADAVVAAMPAAANQQSDLARARAKRRPLPFTRWAPGLAVAAAVALFALVKVNRQDAETSLPAYAVSLRGGDARTRGDAPSITPGTQPWRLRADGPFEIVLRPQTAATQPVAVAAFLRFPPEGALKAWPVVFELGQTGAARLTGSVNELLSGHSGHGDLVFVVYPAASAKPSVDDVTRGPPPLGGQMVIVPVHLLTDNPTP